jgi:transcriptional regulator with XRE-family HTH domain
MVVPWTNIDRARKAKGWTLKRMAEAVGVSESAVQYWKNGKSISLGTLNRLALVLNTTMDALCAEESASFYIVPPSRPGIAREAAPAEDGDMPKLEAIVPYLDDSMLQGTVSRALQAGDYDAAQVAIAILKDRKEKLPPGGQPDITPETTN